MSTATPSLIAQVIDLLCACPSLDDARREALIAAVLAGEVTEEMGQEIAVLFRGEADAMDAGISLFRDARAMASGRKDEALAALPAEEREAVSAHAHELDAASVSYAEKAGSVERRIEARVETITRSGEQDEMEALRGFLAKK